MRGVVALLLLFSCAAGAVAQFRLPAKLSELENTTRKDSNDAAAHYNLAVQERRAAVNANPDDPSLLLDLVKTLAASGDFAGAEQTLQQAMAANPRNSRVPYYLGVVQQQLSRNDDARASLNRFIALAPSRYARQVENARQRLAAIVP